MADRPTHRDAALAGPTELDELRAELTRLARENASLRSQLQTARGVTGAVVSGAPRVSATRRWMGRAIGGVLLLVGFALGVLVALQVGDEFMRGWRDGYEAAGRQSAPDSVEGRP
jgi:hypothetical protein